MIAVEWVVMVACTALLAAAAVPVAVDLIEAAAAVAMRLEEAATAATAACTS